MPLVAAQVADHRELDLRAGRAVPVQRYRNPGALEPPALAFAAVPGDPGLPGGRTRHPPDVAAPAGVVALAGAASGSAAATPQIAINESGTLRIMSPTWVQASKRPKLTFCSFTANCQ